MRTELELQIAEQIRAEISASNAHAVAVRIAKVFNEAAGRTVLILPGSFEPILTDEDFRNLERVAGLQWLSAKAVWFALYPKVDFNHSLLIQLGRQLSARYTKNRKRGATRTYWIESPETAALVTECLRAIDVEKA